MLPGKVKYTDEINNKKKTKNYLFFKFLHYSIVKCLPFKPLKISYGLVKRINIIYKIIIGNL